MAVDIKTSEYDKLITAYCDDFKYALYDMYKKGYIDACEKIKSEEYTSKEELDKSIGKLEIAVDMDVNFQKSVHTSNISTEALESLVDIVSEGKPNGGVCSDEEFEALQGNKPPVLDMPPLPEE